MVVIDALMAKKVMGWKRMEPDKYHKFGFYGPDPEGDPEGTVFIGSDEEYCALSNDGSWILSNLWSPSTNISDALEVFRKIVESLKEVKHRWS